MGLMRKYPINRGKGRGLNSKGVILMVLAFTFLISPSLLWKPAYASSSSTSTVNVVRNSGWEKGDNRFWKESITEQIGGYVSYEVVASNVRFGSYALHVLMDSRDLGLSEGYTTQSFMDSQSAYKLGYLDSNTKLDYWVYPDYDDNGTHINPSARWEVTLYFSTGNRLHYYCHEDMKPQDNSTDKYVRIWAQFGQWNQFWDASVLTAYTDKFGTPPNGTAITKVTTYVIGTTYWDVKGAKVVGNFVRACFDSDEAAGAIEATPIEWTYMVYLDGDNDLDGEALKDFNEMEMAGSTDKVNILVQSDGLWGYYLPSTTRRYYVTKDNDKTDIHSIMLQDMGELNMGDPATLSDFITWAVLEYPARHYALVLWDHGQAPWAWRVCQDYTSNSDWLTMSELKTALNTALSNTDVILDIMGFDACLMQMTEVGYQIKDYVNIMVGSEELEHVSGWPYHTILGNLTASPTMNATILAKTTVDCFGDSGAPVVWPISTLSAVNLTYMDDLAYWVDQLAQHLRDRLEYRKTIREVRSETQEYDVGEAVDLYDFSFRLAEHYGEDGIDDTILFDVSSIMDYVNASVIAEYHAPDRPNSHGLSIYFPDCYYQLSYGDLATYDFASYHWDEFLLDLVGTVGTSVAFSDDMENGTDGWAFTGNWHQTTERSLSPTHSWRVGNQSCYGDSLISPNISIPQSSYVELKIGSWTHIEYFSMCRIWLLEWGARTTLIKDIRDYPQQEWLHYSFDISQYANKTIQIEFWFYGRQEGGGGGWYVDDMSVAYQAHDVAITNVTAYPNAVMVGETVTVTVDTENHGHFTETFNVTAYYGNATITPEQWEIFWSMGDMNRDGYINDTDYSIWLANLGWTGPPGENPADINSDGIVDLSDLQIWMANQGLDIWIYFISRGIIGKQTVSNLAPGSSEQLTFFWNISDVSEGAYCINAEATDVPDDAKMDDNTCQDGTVEVFAWDLLDEPWDSLGTWVPTGTGTTDINPPGELRFLPGWHVSVGRQKDLGAGNLPNQFTVEMKWKVDVWGQSIGFYGRNGIHWILVTIYDDYVGVYLETGWSYYSFATDTNWHVWRIVADVEDEDKVTVYCDNVLVKTWTNIYENTHYSGRVEVSMWSIHKTGDESHQDYIRIASGLHPPTA